MHVGVYRFSSTNQATRTNDNRVSKMDKGGRDPREATSALYKTIVSEFKTDLMRSTFRVPSGSKSEGELCYVCGELGSSWQPMLRCKVCQMSYHRSCVGLDINAFFAQREFQCLECLVWELTYGEGPASSELLECASILLQLQGEGVRRSTAATYNSHLRQYESFAKVCLPTDASLAEEPAITPSRQSLFHIWRYRKGLKAATIRGGSSAISKWHAEWGISFGDEQHQVKRILDAIERRCNEGAMDVDEVGMDPLNIQQLVTILNIMREPNLIVQRDRFLFIMIFYVFLRPSEAGRMLVGDLQIIQESDRLTYLRVIVRPSKNHVDNKTRVVHLQPKSGIHIAAEYYRYLYSITQQGLNNNDPLFPATEAIPNTQGNRRLTRRQISDPSAVFGDRLKHYCEMINIHSYLGRKMRIGCYSLRKGGVTAAFKSGISREVLQYHGRWKSSAIDAYIHFSIERRLSCTACI